MPKTNKGHAGYKGAYWAVVAGPKDPQIIPCPLRQYVRTGDKARVLTSYREQFPSTVIRVIRQPDTNEIPVWKEGM